MRVSGCYDAPQAIAAELAEVRMNETARDEILEAVSHLAHQGQMTFTASDVIGELRRRQTRLAESTIRTHITSRMCANAPDNHDTTYADFERVGRGEYRLITQQHASPY